MTQAEPRTRAAPRLGRVVAAVGADLRHPTAPFDRSERPFIVVATVVVVCAAQWTDSGSVAELAAVCVGAGALVIHAYRPLVPEVLAALVIVPISLAVGDAGNLEVALFLVVLMTLYATWSLGSTVRATVIALAAAACPVVIAVAFAPDSGILWVPWSAAAVFTSVLGRTLQRQRRLIDELAAARRALADQAVADERRRIARELHDLAGHTIAAVLLHVTGARHVLRRDVDEAERALREVEELGRTSLDQIRATVAVLRTTERGTEPPVPGAADLGPLIDEYRRAGLTIEAEIAPRVATIDGPDATAVHRISREALANVARHAPRNVVEIVVDVDEHDTAVRLVVADRGRRAEPPGEGPHFGLVGMRERARALGGDLVAAPTVDGWRVEATVPIHASGSS